MNVDRHAIERIVGLLQALLAEPEGGSSPLPGASSHSFPRLFEGLPSTHVAPPSGFDQQIALAKKETPPASPHAPLHVVRAIPIWTPPEHDYEPYESIEVTRVWF